VEKHKNPKPLFYKGALKLHILCVGLLSVVVLTIFFGENLKAKIGQISKSNDADSQGVAGISSLMNAVNNEDVEGVKFFISAGDNVVNQKNIGGATALHIAARNGNAEIVNILVNNGADVNAIDNEGWTALMRASSFKHPEVVAILVNKNAKTVKLNSFNESALIHSANSECLECLNILINKFDYNSINSSDLKDQINETFLVAKKKDNIPMQQLLANFLEKINKLSPAKLGKNNDGVLEKIYNFMGKRDKATKDDILVVKDEVLTKEATPIIKENQLNQSFISGKELNKKKTLYIFLGKKFSKKYELLQTSDPALTLKVKKESSAKALDSTPSSNKNPIVNSQSPVIYNFNNKNQIRDKSIESELPDSKSEDNKLTPFSEKKYNFLGKKHVAYKIKPLTNFPVSANPVINNPQPALVNPAAVSSNANESTNNNPKTESSSSNNSAPAINASANSEVVPPPPPVKKPSSNVKVEVKKN